MSEDQKQTEISPEELEIKKKALFDRYKRKSYWTFREGLYLLNLHLGPIFYLDTIDRIEPCRTYPIGDDSFDNIIRSFEFGAFGTFSRSSELKKIIDDYREHIVSLEWKKNRSFNRSFLGEGNRPFIGDMDLFIKSELQNKFYDALKVEPILFIKYIEKNLDIFSRIEIPFESLERFKNIWGESKSETKGNTWSSDNPAVTENSKENHYEQLLDLLRKFCPEVERFWKGFTGQLKRTTDQNIAKADVEEFKNIALSFYESNREIFKFLKKHHVDSEEIYKKTGNQKRSTVGKILQMIVAQELPCVAADKKITTSGNVLFELAKNNLPKTD